MQRDQQELAAVRPLAAPVRDCRADCSTHLAPADWSGEANSEQPGLSVELARPGEALTIGESKRAALFLGRVGQAHEGLGKAVPEIVDPARRVDATGGAEPALAEED